MTNRNASYSLLLGVAVAGALIWVATRVDGNSTWRYWATLGVLAGAGLVFAIAQRAAYTAWAAITVPAFLLAFIPAAAVAGWIAIAGMPHSNWLHDHIVSWSGDIGVGGLVNDLTHYVVVMAFGIGALVASAPGLLAVRPVDDETVADDAAARAPAARRSMAIPAGGPAKDSRSRQGIGLRPRGSARV